jgi:hypothetical protein
MASCISVDIDKYGDLVRCQSICYARNSRVTFISLLVAAHDFSPSRRAECGLALHTTWRMILENDKGVCCWRGEAAAGGRAARACVCVCVCVCSGMSGA